MGVNFVPSPRHKRNKWCPSWHAWWLKRWARIKWPQVQGISEWFPNTDSGFLLSFPLRPRRICDCTWEIGDVRGKLIIMLWLFQVCTVLRFHAPWVLVDPADTNHLQQGDNHQWKGSHETVKHADPVHAGFRDKNESDDHGNWAKNSWKRWKNKKKKKNFVIYFVRLLCDLIDYSIDSDKPERTVFFIHGNSFKS